MIVHVPLIINSGLIEDDWLIFKIKPGYIVQTDFFIHGAGGPFAYALVTLANFSGHPIAFMKILSLAGIAIGAVNLKAFLVRLRVFSDLEAAAFSFLVWSYAGFGNWAGKLLSVSVFSFGLLCLGLNLLSIAAGAGRPRVWLRLCSLVAIFCSFSLNSLIAVYGIGLFAIFFIQTSMTRESLEGLPSRLVAIIRRFPDFLALPFIFWFLVNHFFPKIGVYKEYYQIRMPRIDEVLSGLSDFWRWGFDYIVGQAIDIMDESSRITILAFVIGFGFVALIAYRRENRPAIQTSSVGAVTWPAVAAVITFVVCASPYLAGGVRPDGHFFNFRHLLFFGIPLGLLLICACRIVGLFARNKIAVCVIIAVSLSTNLCALWSGYFVQQAHWLRLEAMINDLRRAYPQPPAAVFNLADGFFDYPWHTAFGIAEITGALHLAWDQRPLLGFSGRSERPTVLQEVDKLIHTEGTAFRNIDVWGPQATIQLEPAKPVLTNYRLSRNYYLCLIRTCDTRSLIDDLATTTVRTGPIPNLLPPGS